MRAMNKQMCEIAMRRTMAHQPGSSHDASAVAQATISTLRQVNVILAPVIGAHGVYVLFKRVLHLSSKAFPWLLMAENLEDNPTLLTSLSVCMEGRNSDEAAEASCALLVSFNELLTTLIGESLVERLLDPVWASLSPPSKEEPTS